MARAGPASASRCPTRRAPHEGILRRAAEVDRNDRSLRELKAVLGLSPVTAPEIRTLFTALIVDDDPDFRESLGLIVAGEGYEVSQAGCLLDARQCLAASHPDVVLVDLMLPDGEGTELLHDEQLVADSEI